MTIETRWISYGDGETGFYAFPERAKAPFPAVIVLQEAWGVDAHIEDVTTRFAAAGYAALAPDLFAVKGTRPEVLAKARMAELKAFVEVMPPAGWMDNAVRESALAKLGEPATSRVRETMAAMFGLVSQPANLVPKLLAATTFLREENALTKGAPIGSVGFCMGGGLSALLACHDPKLGAAVVFYGMAPPADLIPKVTCPILGLYGSTDARVNAGISGFEEAMKSAGKHYAHKIYEGADHAFFNDGRPAYHAAAARDAFARTLALFGRTLA